jgi:hypothetical protein
MGLSENQHNQSIPVKIVFFLLGDFLRQLHLKLKIV